MVSEPTTGRLTITITWTLDAGNAERPACFDWKLSQEGAHGLDDDQIETLLREVASRI
ncbi:MAG: hypothetical protein QOJ35_1574 [Solirubrobacteraceae bacterium]|jgi:hypothetical protein|nr:hypothetical protein [Solirubrobacteraceae bacterium]